MIWIVGVFVFWVVAWAVNVRVAKATHSRFTAFAVPALFGITLLMLWEGIARGFEVNPVLLPPPSAIAVTFASSIPILWGILCRPL